MDFNFELEKLKEENIDLGTTAAELAASHKAADITIRLLREEKEKVLLNMQDILNILSLRAQGHKNGFDKRDEDENAIYFSGYTAALSDLSAMLTKYGIEGFLNHLKK